MSDIADRVRGIIAEHLCIDGKDAFDEAILVEDLGADDLDLIELTLLFEDVFHIEIPDNHAVLVDSTVKDVIDRLTALVG